MAMQNASSVITVEELVPTMQQRKADGWSYIQMLAVRVDAGVDLVYTLVKDNVMEDIKIVDIAPETEVPSITDMYLSAFVFENEAHDLFGVKITGIAIDFKGNFYATSVPQPMSIISPEQKAARERAAKVAAAKAAKEAKAKGESKGADADADAEMEAKLAAMDPEKAAKVRAAMAAKAAKAARVAKEGE